jgi:hypothetical protein
MVAFLPAETSTLCQQVDACSPNALTSALKEMAISDPYDIHTKSAAGDQPSTPGHAEKAN